MEFADALLPSDVPLLGEGKKLTQKKHDLFINEGELALPEIRKINARLKELLEESKSDFPLTHAQAAELRANLRDILLKISAVEQQAVEILQSALL